MSTRMLIDTRHSEETRVTVVKGSRVEEFDYESSTRKQLKGNIYLARVTRVEPSLQAAFVEYGGNRHGFLAFSEIHPDYYQIPVEDRQALLEAEAAAAEMDAKETETEAAKPKRRRRRSRSAQEKTAKIDAEVSGIVDDADADADAAEDSVSTNDETDSQEATGAPSESADDVDTSETEVQNSDEDEKDAAIEEAAKRRQMLKNLKRKYNIQEVIKRRQVLLIQVVKEERGNKGAALTTYLSLAGRYCVLMPNSTHSGGISRKISSMADRKKLKQVISSLEVSDDMGLIVRTAGMQRTKTEIKRDYDYLLRLWNGIRELTLQSTAPALVYEEGNLIKRTIRDLYTRDVDEILVEGEEGYRMAKDFMKLLMPSHAKKVQHYKDRIPLFHRYQVESHLEAMYNPVVQLKSGGYLVINPTEALISIDVNSGRSTKEHNIEETALKTNIEAADEVARQLRLRDMAGLIVIDFIDMEDRGNNRSVERRIKDALKSDRARIQVGRISTFGLMEMSRQRMRPNLLEITMETCKHCSGSGIVRSVESASLMALRQLEEEGIRNRSSIVRVSANPEVAVYLLNKKRALLSDLEQNYNLSIEVLAKPGVGQSDIEITREAGPGAPEEVAQHQAVTPESSSPTSESVVARIAAPTPQQTQAPSRTDDVSSPATDDSDDDQPKRRRRRRRRRRRGASEEVAQSDGQQSNMASPEHNTSTEHASPEEVTTEAETTPSDDSKPPRRRRGSRGGRKQRSNNRPTVSEGAESQPSDAAGVVEAVPAVAVQDESTEDPKPRRRRRIKKPDTDAPTSEPVTTAVEVAATEATTPVKTEVAGDAPDTTKPKRRPRKKVEDSPALDSQSAAISETTPEKPKRTRRTPAKSSGAKETSEVSKPAPRKRAPRKTVAKDASVASEKKSPAPTKPEATSSRQAPSNTADAGPDDGSRRKGWWQRTFG